ncbi:hypothetical protein MTR67_017136 [Solanum verrucosum]|uniref:Uncharacterized protein n=1 Tax=Solanum verrucosum TaxID=315347 RepID=A0AAF0TL76_SOLVR|nr:uncharacterized protein LOC125818812 [Solanum verrucosum]WMV23751.1 hypothetical protein MTR67_017136 [Solanum verrucosum]
MDIEVDHYSALDLPSGEEGAKLSEIDISKAYRKKALELHPDKRLDDPINAHLNFQKLKASYDILKDDKKRKLFDEMIQLQQQQQQHQQQQEDSKRRKMMSFVPDINLARLEEEERIAIKLLGEIARIREILLSKKESSEMCVDKEKVLKVSWSKSGGEDYTCQRLRELFSNFGEVEHVIMGSSSKNKKRSYALVEMLSKADAAKAVSSSGITGLLIVPLVSL